MRAIRTAIPLFIAFALLGTTDSAGAEARRAGFGGRVFGEKSPLPAAGVYAYQLADLSLHKAKTDLQGNFLFRELPAGLYKIIAHKPGFVPVVVMLTRTTAQAYQTLEVQLLKRQVGQGPESDDFWSLRAKVPSDVLRDIEKEEVRMVSFTPPPGGSLTSGAIAGFQTEMQALTGVDSNAFGEGQVSGGGLGIKGQIGEVDLKLQGRFLKMDGMSPGMASGGGQTSALSLDLGHGDNSRFRLSSTSSNRGPRSESGDGPVDYEHHQVNYSQEIGENGRSEFAAQYTAENNFHRQASFDPMDIPEMSRTLLLEGAYTAELGDHNTLQAGLRYRERQFGLSDRPGQAYEQPALGSVDLFGRGGVRVQPAVLVEYGMYSTLSDGSLSLMPQGGLVVQLGANWQAAASAARRVYEETPGVPDFLPSLYQQSDLCEQGSEACYELRLSRAVGEDNSFSISAIHRHVADTLRLYFSEDFFDRQESLYLVRGDELPELRMSMSRRLSPKVVSTLESSLASGGGGIFFAPNGQRYENEVRYMVTSLDTQFQSTSTGVFVAFHHLSQQLDAADASLPETEPVEYERLRLMVSQDLSFLLDLAADWAVQLNMELSRGNAIASDPEGGVRHRFLGGIAVKF